MKKLIISVLLIMIVATAYAATTYTTNYGFSKPDDGDTGWGGAIRGNWDSADALFKTLSDSIGLTVSIAQVDSVVSAELTAYWDTSNTTNWVRSEISDSLATLDQMDSTTVSALIGDSLAVHVAIYTDSSEVSALISDSLDVFKPDTLYANYLNTKSASFLTALDTLTGAFIIADSLEGVVKGAIADTAFVNTKISLTALADSVTFEVLEANGDVFSSGAGTGQFVEAADVFRLTGDQTVTSGTKTFTIFPRKSGTLSSLNPTYDPEFATKYYVDNNTVTQGDITFTNLNLNGSVGTGASQVMSGASVLSAISDSLDTISTTITGLVLPIRALVADDTLDTTDYAILADSMADTVRVTIPTAASVEGRMFSIKKVDNSANPVIVVTQGGNSIDSAAGDTLTTLHQVVRIISSGSQWYKQ